MGLFKTTIVIWSEYNPSADSVTELSDFARDAESGESYCSKFDTEFVHAHENDPDWDGTEFFNPV